MKINVHIERLIVDDFGIQPQQREELKVAVAAAIRQQLVIQGIGFTAQTASHRRSVKADSIAIADSPNAESLSQQIGHAVYGSIRHE